MRSFHVLVLILLSAVLAGAAWWVLDASPADSEVWDEDPFPDPASTTVHDPEQGAAIATMPRPTVVELPAEVDEPRVAILPEGAELPPEGGEASSAIDVQLHESFLEGDPTALTGADLLDTIAGVARVRFQSEADLAEIRGLGPDPDWTAENPLPLAEVVEHWRRAGFRIELRGPYLRILREETERE